VHRRVAPRCTAAKKTTKNAAKKTARAARPASRTTAKPAAAKEPRVSMWGTAREFIKAGKTNADVLAVLRERFSLPEKQSFYPVWYRAYAVKHGVVSREFAKAHAGPPLARKPATA
jgi:hypothetical protein